MADRLAKKLGLKTGKIHYGMFDFSVYIVVGDYEKTLKWVADFLQDGWVELDQHSRGYVPRGKTFFRAGWCPIIWIPGLPKTPEQYGTLAHEAIHASMRLIDWAAIPINTTTDEVLAHATSYIVREVLIWLRKK